MQELPRQLAAGLPAGALRLQAKITEVSDSGILINAVVLSATAPGYAPVGGALVAASVPGRADASLEPRVRTCLARLYQISTRDWELLGTYPIPHALPTFPAGQPLRRPVRLGPGRYVCGDHRDTPSIQGALVSGGRAAVAVLTDLTRRVVAPQPGQCNSDFRSRGDEAASGLGGLPGGR